MNLKTTSLIISLIGILILLLIINTSEPKETLIKNINSSLLEKQVKITGQVINSNTFKNNFTVLTIQQNNNQINITCNCPNININQSISIIGTVEKYKEQIQINANQIY